jgi:hypothetical protein
MTASISGSGMGERFSFSLRHFAFSPCSPANSFSHLSPIPEPEIDAVTGEILNAYAMISRSRKYAGMAGSGMGERFSFSLRHFAFSPCSPANSFSHFWASMADIAQQEICWHGRSAAPSIPERYRALPGIAHHPERHSGHASIFPAARYHGVSVEDLPSDCIDFRLRNSMQSLGRSSTLTP